MGVFLESSFDYRTHVFCVAFFDFDVFVHSISNCNHVAYVSVVQYRRDKQDNEYVKTQNVKGIHSDFF